MMLTYGAYTSASMAASFVVETERWDDAEQLLSSPPEPTAESGAKPGADPSQVFAALARTPAVFARGLAAAMTGAADAQQSTAALQAVREQIAGIDIPFVARLDPVLKMQALEITAAASAAKGDLDEAIRTMEKAIALTETPPPPGPPTVIKPPHELFGEILLRAGRPEEAARRFATALFRHPDRARSLLGAARAAARSGDTRGAADLYSEFLHQWRHANARLPELSEAENSSAQSSAQ
jgi:tetratricopeptide (TPR) repeat protein